MSATLQSPDVLVWTFDTAAQAHEALQWLSRCGLDDQHLALAWLPGGTTFTTRQASAAPATASKCPATAQPTGLLPRGIRWDETLDEVGGDDDG